MTRSIHDLSGARPARRNGSTTFSAAVSVGTKLNDWNTKPTRSRRSRVSCRSSSEQRLTSSMYKVPLSTVSSQARQCRSVDLPEPEGPSTAVNRPAPIATDTSSRAVTFAYRLLTATARTATTGSFMPRSSARPAGGHIRSQPAKIPYLYPNGGGAGMSRRDNRFGLRCAPQFQRSEPCPGRRCDARIVDTACRPTARCRWAGSRDAAGAWLSKIGMTRAGTASARAISVWTQSGSSVPASLSRFTHSGLMSTRTVWQLLSATPICSA